MQIEGIGVSRVGHLRGASLGCDRVGHCVTRLGDDAGFGLGDQVFQRQSLETLQQFGLLTPKDKDLLDRINSENWYRRGQVVVSSTPTPTPTPAPSAKSYCELLKEDAEVICCQQVAGKGDLCIFPTPEQSHCLNIKESRQHEFKENCIKPLVKISGKVIGFIVAGIVFVCLLACIVATKCCGLFNSLPRTGESASPHANTLEVTDSHSATLDTSEPTEENRTSAVETNLASEANPDTVHVDLD